MIKVNELRIGNCVHKIDAVSDGKEIKYSNRLYFISAYDIYHIVEDGDPTNHQIPLTPDWLRKCGFGYIASENVSYYIRIGLNLLLEFDQNLVCRLALETPMYKTIIPSSAEIKYLHQLQNIYFDHTGKELEIKL